MEGFTRWFKFCLQFIMATAALNPEVERASSPVSHGEGPVWDEIGQKLYHVDISAQRIYRLDPSTGKSTFAYLGCGPVGAVALVKGSSDKLVAGCGREIVLVTWDGENNATDPPFEVLARVDTDRSDTRVNDGKCDPAGRFWIGTMGLEINDTIEPNLGSLYRYKSSSGRNEDPKKVLSSVTVSNGLAWNKDKDTMYYIDSPTRQIVSFDYDNDSGDLVSPSKKVVFDLEKNNIAGVPDGMTIDEDDNLWIAVYAGSAVIKVDPSTGKLLEKIDLPAERITSVAFGGPEFEILYVTSSAFGLTEAQKNAKPESGSVFALKNLNARGLPASKFQLDE